MIHRGFFSTLWRQKTGTFDNILPEFFPQLINGFFRLKDTEANVDKRAPYVVKMKELVDAEYANGRNTVMGDYELETMLKKVDFETYQYFAHIHENIAADSE